ncbi:MAG TPA: hypothetical protein VKV21_16890 [Solirubrobacteraceae bacterium]|nr:hypothetical protein [Solirubrobacteraceae bacterium]
MTSTAQARRAHGRSARGRSAGRASRRREGALALALYLALAFGLIGRAALAGRGGFGSGTLGTGPDVQIFVWGLRWWPHALGHGLDPLKASVVWPPTGGAVLWSTTVPLLSVLATPLTLTVGSLATWNVLIVLAPATAAWAAWLLCAELGAGPPGAVFGGALFGFGSFVLCEDIAHLQLSACLLLPLAARVAVRGVRAGASAGSLALASGAIVVAQFLIFPELLVTLGLMAIIGLVAALWLLGDERDALLRTARAMAAGALAGALVISPLVVQMLTHVPRGSSGAVAWPIDLLNFAVPTVRTALGGPSLTGISARFPGNVAEQTGYLGLPLLLVILAWGWRERGRPGARLLLVMLAVAVLLALGSSLTVDGARTIWLPWAALAKLPFLRDALPARMTVFVSLCASVIAARWVGDARLPPWLRACAVALIVASLVPSAWPFQPEPPAARSRAVARALRGQRVLSLPFFDVRERGLLVQQSHDFRFGLIDGWLQLRPRGWATDLPGTALTARALARLGGRDTARFVADLRAAGITRLLLWEEPPGLLAALHLPYERLDGVVIVRVSAP